MPQLSMVPDPCRVVAVVPQNARDVRFVVEVPSRHFAPEPGQFVMASLLGIGEAPFCVSALPGEGAAAGTFEMLIRRVGRLTNLLTRLTPGETMYVRGPYGRRVDWEQFEGSSLIVMAGGLGLAPLRAFVHRALRRRGAFRRIDVMVGARSPDEMLFRDELADWKARRDDVHVRLIVDAAREDWGGRIGVITTLLDNFEGDTEDTYAFLCGPPVMYRHCIKRLLALGLYENHLWMTLERQMRCGIGLCGHCQVSGRYLCQEGPLFSYQELRHLQEAV